METKIFEYGENEITYLKNADSQMKELIEEYGMIQRVVIPDLYTALINTVVGQLISTKAADTVFDKMIQLFKDFTPERVSAFTADEIQACGITMRKAVVIESITKAIVNEELDLESLKQMSDEEVIKSLTVFKGIGEWTAEMMLIHSLERKNVMSYKDLAIRRGLCRLYNLDEISMIDFEKYKKRYAPYATIASFYLWALSHA